MELSRASFFPSPTFLPPHSLVLPRSLDCKLFKSAFLPFKPQSSKSPLQGCKSEDNPGFEASPARVLLCKSYCPCASRPQISGSRSMPLPPQLRHHSFSSCSSRVPASTLRQHFHNIASVFVSFDDGFFLTAALTLSSARPPPLKLTVRSMRCLHVYFLSCNICTYVESN